MLTFWLKKKNMNIYLYIILGCFFYSPAFSLSFLCYTFCVLMSFFFFLSSSGMQSCHLLFLLWTVKSIKCGTEKKHCSDEGILFLLFLFIILNHSHIYIEYVCIHTHTDTPITLTPLSGKVNISDDSISVSVSGVWLHWATSKQSGFEVDVLEAGRMGSGEDLSSFDVS